MPTILGRNLSVTAAAAALAIILAVTSPVQAQDASLRLDPNTASADELAAVDALPDALASAILAGRPFARTADFDALVSTNLEDDAKPALYAQIFLPIELNSATRDEIALIPGMTRRMIREFEEYRPYDDLGEFEREIGKYVDADEVARLRSYVRLGS